MRPPFDWQQCEDAMFAFMRQEHDDYYGRRPSLWQRLAPFVLLFVVAAALTAGLLMLAAERSAA